MLFRESSGVIGKIADPFCGYQVRHMDNQRIEARAALCLVDASDRLRILSICGEAVDGLRRNRDGLSFADQARRLRDGLVVERKYPGGLDHPAAAIGPCMHHQVEHP
jgi:hypothetical protein